MSSASALVTFSLTAFGAPSTRSFASFRPSPVSSRTTLMTWIFFSPAAPRMTSNSVFSSVAAPPAAPAPAPGIAATATGAAADTPHFSCSSLESWAASSSVSLSSCSAICSTVDIDQSPLSLSIELGMGTRAVATPMPRRNPPRRPIPSRDQSRGSWPCRHAHAPPQSPAAANPVSRSEPWLLALSPRPCPAAIPRGGLFVPPVRGAAHGAAPLLQDVHEVALRRREHADEPREDPLDHAHELTAELLPRRQVGERPELRRRQHLPLDVARLDRQRLVGLGEAM